MNRKLRRAEKQKNKRVPRDKGNSGATYPEAERDFAEAMRLREAGQTEEAKLYYRKVLRIQPDHSVALHHLGVIALQTVKSEDLVDFISKADKAQPVHPFAHNNLGNALRNVGRLEGAEAAYTSAISQKADYAEAHYNRAIVHEDRKNAAAAMSDYNKAVEIKPGYADAYVGMGVLLNL